MADDIVTRLRRDFGTHRHVSETDRKMVAAAADEIERLRAAGDALATAALATPVAAPPSHIDMIHKCLAAWRQARR